MASGQTPEHEEQSEPFRRGWRIGYLQGFTQSFEETLWKQMQARIVEVYARMLIESLAAQGLELDARQRAWIDECQDPHVLKSWLFRSASEREIETILVAHGPRDP